MAGGYRVRLCADGPALRYVNAAGKTVRSLPRPLRAELADLRLMLKELKRAQTAERLRLEQALVHEREWTWPEVAEHLLDHPVTGAYTRALLRRVPGGPAGPPVRTDEGRPSGSPSTATANRRRWRTCRRWCCRRSSATRTSPWAWPRSAATTRRYAATITRQIVSTR
ncbi:DUF4132 domain-containing protein [Herbidospora mongoliensis]|uniref:DUF4132 domain-containing protein n=1 Tax=Herbidospora mongoliensis TaxID=688067 RepID=UPI00082E09F9|nr:DUF4132 domain-containing protein [Herbidospora mongoliensis]